MPKTTDARHAMRPKVYIVGVGPGSAKYVTGRARDAIRASEIVLGWELDLLPIRKLLSNKEVHIQNVSNYREVAKTVSKLALKAGKTVAVPRVGDPSISSGLAGLLEIFSGFDVEIIPGISSAQVAASLARVNIDDSVIVSFHDYGDHEREKKFTLDAFRAGKHLIILTSPDLTMGEAAKLLISSGLNPSISAVACSNLSLKEEAVEFCTLESVSNREYHWLSLLVVVNPAIPTNQEAYSSWRRWRSIHGKHEALSSSTTSDKTRKR